MKFEFCVIDSIYFCIYKFNLKLKKTNQMKKEKKHMNMML